MNVKIYIIKSNCKATYLSMSYFWSIIKNKYHKISIHRNRCFFNFRNL